MNTSTITKPKLSFSEACAQYVHRYTLQHIPQWAKQPMPNGNWYAPQYLTDQEWYDNTVFPPHNGQRKYCTTSNQSWPLGTVLEAPLINKSAIDLVIAEAIHYRNTGRGKEYLEKAIKQAQTLNTSVTMSGIDDCYPQEYSGTEEV
jgi:hypothetical protein